MDRCLAARDNLGLAIGQPVFATALSGGVVPDDGGLVLEGWYRFQLSDAIRITPAVFHLSRPLGQTTPLQQTFSQIGALLKTTIAF